MGVADTGRFYMKPGHQGVPVSGPPPRFRPPPPPEERRPVMSRRVPEYHDTSGEGEDILYDPIVPDYRSWDRRKTNYAAMNLNQKYKTLEPRSKSGGDAHSLERLNPPRSGPSRVLPDVPSHSLPRQGKRAQSDSRSRDRAEAEAGSLLGWRVGEEKPGGHRWRGVNVNRGPHEDHAIPDKVANLKEELETQRGQTKAYREYINSRAEKDLEMTGGAVATDWKKRLDEYIAQVSAVVKLRAVFGDEVVLALKPLQT